MLRIVDEILGLIREVAPVAVKIGRQDAALAKQFRDALTSAALNASEGSGQHGARRANHYAIALGSADEAFVALKAAVAWGYLEGVDAHVADTFDKIVRTLNKVARP